VQTLDHQKYTYLQGYCRLWLFSACTYKLRLQETMRLTDNVRLTSGIIVATPSMKKHVTVKLVIDHEHWTCYTANDKNGEDDKRPSVRRLYFSWSCRTWHKTAVLPCCIMEKFYAKHSLLYNGKILCQRCLAATQGKLLCWNVLHKIPLCKLCTEKQVQFLS